MQFGNRSNFAIELNPLAPSWERTYRPEKSAWAALSIWAGGENLCRHVAAGEEQIESAVNVPLGPIVDWIVRSWPFIQFEERPITFPPDLSAAATLRRWGDVPAPSNIDFDAWTEQREEWWARHFLLAGAEGALLPNLGLVRSLDSLSIEWSTARFGGARRIEFLTKPRQVLVGWAEAEDTIARFASFVADWMRREGLEDVYRWVDLADPIRSLPSNFDDAAAAYTGRTVTELARVVGANSPDELRSKLDLSDESVDPSASVAAQVLRDLPPGITSGLASQVLKTAKYSRAPGGFEPEIRVAAREAATATSAPEDAGLAAAIEARRLLGLDGQPIENLPQLLSELPVRVEESGVSCQSERMTVGARRDGSAVAILNLTPRTSVNWGKRFELSRALAYLLLAPFREGALGGASSTFSQPWLRRASGAFAAEFLLPTSALSDEISGLDRAADPTVFRRLMDRYGVGARTAAYQLWNRDLFSSPQVRDELIDRFAAVASRGHWA